VGLVVRSALLSRILAEINVISYLYPVNGRQHTHTLDSISTVLLDTEILGTAVGISLLSCVTAVICITEFLIPPSGISDFRLLAHC